MTDNQWREYERTRPTSTEILMQGLVKDIAALFAVVGFLIVLGVFLYQ